MKGVKTRRKIACRSGRAAEPPHDPVASRAEWMSPEHLVYMQSNDPAAHERALTARMALEGIYPHMAAATAVDGVLGRASDVWSFGVCVLTAILQADPDLRKMHISSGYRPFATDALSAAAGVKGGTPQADSLLGLLDVAKRCTELEPSRRLTMAQAESQLEALLLGVRRTEADGAPLSVAAAGQATATDCEPQPHGGIFARGIELLRGMSSPDALKRRRSGSLGSSQSADGLESGSKRPRQGRLPEAAEAAAAAGAGGAEASPPQSAASWWASSAASAAGAFSAALGGRGFRRSGGSASLPQDPHATE